MCRLRIYEDLDMVAFQALVNLKLEEIQFEARLTYIAKLSHTLTVKQFFFFFLNGCNKRR